MSSDHRTPYDDEIARRRLERSAVRVVTLPEPREWRRPFAPGTVGCAWAVRGSDQLARLVAAIDADDAGGVADALAEEVAIDEGALARSRELADGEPIERAPVLGELRYRGKRLLQGATYLPYTTDHLSIDQLPYSGGRLDADGFDAVSYCLPDAAPLEFVVVVDPPKQGDTERALVEAVPPELSEVHVGRSLEPMSAVVAARVANDVTRQTYLADRGMATKAVADAANRWVKDQVRNYERTVAEWAVKNALHTDENLRARAVGGPAVGQEIPEDQLARLRDLDPTAASQQLVEIRRALLSLPDPPDG